MDISTTGQAKLMPILEGENENKPAITTENPLLTNLEEQEKPGRKRIGGATTIAWTPFEVESTPSQLSNDSLYELSVKADSVLKTSMQENSNGSGEQLSTITAGADVPKKNDRTIRKSVSAISNNNSSSRRTLTKMKSDMGETKKHTGHVSRASTRYLTDDPKIIAEIEELELEYLFNYIRHLKTFAKYSQMTEEEILAQVENDPHTLRNRTKEIVKGKLSESYVQYIQQYPIKKQRRKEHPTTPNKYKKMFSSLFRWSVANLAS